MAIVDLSTRRPTRRESTFKARRRLSRDPDSPKAEEARSLIETPKRARFDLIPDFEVVTLDGEYLTTEDLRGKVVLLDFWGTWCAPCRSSVPHLRRIHRHLDGAPFVLLSVSTDGDKDILESFIAEHRMSWSHVWDQRHELSRGTFQVTSYPTYILFDHEGVKAFRHSGWGPSIEREIDRRVASAIRAVRKDSRKSAKPTDNSNATF